MASGVVFALALFLTAVFNINPWQDHTYQLAPPIVAGMPAPHKDGREKMVCSSCHIVTSAKAGANSPAGVVLPIPVGSPSPHQDKRSQMDCAQCHTMVPKGAALPPATSAAGAKPVALGVAFPVEGGGEEETTIPPERFQGLVVKVAGSGVNASMWSDVFVMVDDRINDPVWVSLAPRWYLQSLGCQVRPGVFIKGMMFRALAPDSPAPAYAMSISVNGEKCRLRDTHMRGRWLENGGGGDAE